MIKVTSPAWNDDRSIFITAQYLELLCAKDKIFKLHFSLFAIPVLTYAKIFKEICMHELEKYIFT